MRIDQIHQTSLKRKHRRRVGRGIGSGSGKTSGRGQKGMYSRTGLILKQHGFEGGQMPLVRRIPKRGFHNPFRKEVGIINVRDLAAFGEGAVVDVEALVARGLVHKGCDAVKLLADGDAPKGVTVKVHRVSAAARSKVEGAGGTVELLA